MFMVEASTSEVAFGSRKSERQRTEVIDFRGPAAHAEQPARWFLLKGSPRICQTRIQTISELEVTTRNSRRAPSSQLRSRCRVHPGMATNGTESSLLISLRDLRDLEAERAAERAAAARAAAAAAEAAREAARVQAAREDALRVAAVEATARAEAMVRIEADRAALEAALRREVIARQRPRWLMAVAGGLTMIAIAFAWMAMRAQDDARAQQRAASDAAARADQARQAVDAAAAEVCTMQRLVDDANARLDARQRRLDEMNDRVAPPQPPKKPGGKPGKGDATGPSPRPRPGEIEVCTDSVLC
ncbi:MAG TPA: hypothetical protein VM734_27355 [Kofleriaceae bacterium]|nr:hypothetical protein [Kofleriaceae bacterium]